MRGVAASCGPTMLVNWDVAVSPGNSWQAVCPVGPAICKIAWHAVAYVSKSKRYAPAFRPLALKHLPGGRFCHSARPNRSWRTERDMVGKPAKGVVPALDNPRVGILNNEVINELIGGFPRDQLTSAWPYGSTPQQIKVQYPQSLAAPDPKLANAS